jgi:lipopolysaccharide export system permease protein
MRLVDRLILHELMAPFFNSVFLFLMLVFASTYLFRMNDLLISGVPARTVALLSLYLAPALVTQSLPMAMLLGNLLAFGRLSADSEHIALYASGISFLRAIRPVAVMGVLVSLFGFLWNELVVPPSIRAYFDLFAQANENIRAKDQPLDYTLRREDGSVDEFVSIAGGYDARNKMLRKVTIVKMSDDPKRKGEPEVRVYADRAKASDPHGLDWVYYDVYVRDIRPDMEESLVDVHMEKATTQTLPQNVRIGRDFQGIIRAEVTDNRRMTFRQLRDKIEKARAQGNTTYADEVDLWEKVAFPAASLIFGLVGAALGVRPHRGSRAMGFGIAIAIIFLYWIIYSWMYRLGKGGAIEPMLASFGADLLGFVAAIILIYRTRQ